MITADITSTPVEATPPRAYAGALGRLYEGAAESFAHPTAAVVDRSHASHGPPGTRAATVADPEVIADLADAPELRAIEELRAWLRLSYEDVARAAGLSGASLLHHWRQRYRTGSPVRPRAATVEQLWRVHALIRAVAEALEGADQSYAVGLWARRPEDGVTPLELLLAGSVDEVERRAARLLFDRGARPAPYSRVAAAESDDELGPVDAPPAPEYQDSDFG
jgi:AcrR family transcriptional regulator